MYRKWSATTWFYGVLAGLAVTLSGCEAPPHQPYPQQAPPSYPAPQVVYPAPVPAYSYADIRRCRDDNQRVHAEVLRLFDQARAGGRISPNEAQRFGEMDGRVRNMAFQLERDGLTMDECVYIRNALEQNRNEVLRMTRRDPAVGRCMADNRRAHQETVTLYENARRSGRINPAEMQQFNAMEARLANFRAQLASDGISLQDCQRIGNAIASERNEVARMSRHDPGVGRCIADNRRAHDDIYAVYNNALAAGRIRPGEAQRFQAMEKRLAAFQADMKRNGYTLAECQAVSRNLARERAAVEQMVRNP